MSIPGVTSQFTFMLSFSNSALPITPREIEAGDVSTIFHDICSVEPEITEKSTPDSEEMSKTKLELNKSKLDSPQPIGNAIVEKHAYIETVLDTEDTCIMSDDFNDQVKLDSTDTETGESEETRISRDIQTQHINLPYEEIVIISTDSDIQTCADITDYTASKTTKIDSNLTQTDIHVPDETTTIVDDTVLTNVTPSNVESIMTSSDVSELHKETNISTQDLDLIFDIPQEHITEEQFQAKDVETDLTDDVTQIGFNISVTSRTHLTEVKEDTSTTGILAESVKENTTKEFVDKKEETTKVTSQQTYQAHVETLVQIPSSVKVLSQTLFDKCEITDMHDIFVRADIITPLNSATIPSEQTDEPSTLVLEELPSESIKPDGIDEVTLQPTKTVVEEVSQIDEQTVPIESTPEDLSDKQYTTSESVDIISSYEEIVPRKNDLEDISAPHEITSVAIPGIIIVDINTREEDQEETETFEVTEESDETDIIVREELTMQIGDEPQKLKEIVLMISPAGVVPSEPSRELVHTTEVTTEITVDDSQTTEEVSVTVEEEPAVIVSEKPEEVCVAPVTTPSTDLVEKLSISATQPEEESYFEPESVPRSPNEKTVMEMPIEISMENEEEKHLENDQTVITKESVETDTFVREEISFQVGDEPKKMGEVTLVISPTGIVSSEQTDEPSETTLVLEELPSKTIKPDEIDKVTLQPTKTVVEEVTQIDEQTVPIETTPKDLPEEQYTKVESVDIISSYEKIVLSKNDLEHVSAPHEVTSVTIPGIIAVDIDTREAEQEETKTFEVTEESNETDMIVREELTMQIGDEPQKLKEVVLMISPAGVVPSEPSRELVHTTEVTTEITVDDSQTTEEVSVTVEEEPEVIVSEKPEEVSVAPVTTPSTDLVEKPSMSATQPEKEIYFEPENVPRSPDEQTIMEMPIVEEQIPEAAEKVEPAEEETTEQEEITVVLSHTQSVKPQESMVGTVEESPMSETTLEISSAVLEACEEQDIVQGIAQHDVAEKPQSLVSSIGETTGAENIENIVLETEETTQEEEVTLMLAQPAVQPKEQTMVQPVEDDLAADVIEEITLTEVEQTNEQETLVEMEHSTMKIKPTNLIDQSEEQQQEENIEELAESPSEMPHHEEIRVSLAQPDVKSKAESQVETVEETTSEEIIAEIVSTETENTTEGETDVVYAQHEVDKQTEMLVGVVEEKSKEEETEDLGAAPQEVIQEKEIGIQLESHDKLNENASTHFEQVEEKQPEESTEIVPEIVSEITTEPDIQRIDLSQPKRHQEPVKRVIPQIEELSFEDTETVSTLQSDVSKEEDTIVDLTRLDIVGVSESHVQLEFEKIAEELAEGTIGDITTDTTNEEKIEIDLSQIIVQPKTTTQVAIQEEQMSEEGLSDAERQPSPVITQQEDIFYDMAESTKEVPQETRVEHTEEVQSESSLEENISEFEHDLVDEEEIKVDLDEPLVAKTDVTRVDMITEGADVEEGEDIFFEAPELAPKTKDVSGNLAEASIHQHALARVGTQEAHTTIELTKEGEAEFTENVPQGEIVIQLDKAAKAPGKPSRVQPLEEITVPTSTEILEDQISEETREESKVVVSMEVAKTQPGKTSLVAQQEEILEPEETNPEVMTYEEEELKPEEMLTNVDLAEATQRPATQVQRVEEDGNPELVVEEYTSNLKEVYMFPGEVRPEYEPSVVERYRFEAIVHEPHIPKSVQLEMPKVVSVEDEGEKHLEDDQTVITEKLVETDTFVREEISFQVGDEPNKMGEVTLVISPTGIVSDEQTDEPSETTLVLEEFPFQTTKPDEIDEVVLQPTKNTVIEEVTQFTQQTVTIESTPEDLPEEQYTSESVDIISSYDEIGPSKNDLEDVSAPHEITTVVIPGRVTVDIDTREEDQEEVKTFDVTEVIDETDMIVREELTMQIGDEPQKLKEVVLMISPAGVVPSEPSREPVHTTEVTTEITVDDSQTTEEVSVSVEEEPAAIVSEKPEEVCVAPVTTPSTDLVEKPSMSTTQPEEEIYFEPENVPRSPDKQTVMEMPIVVSVDDEEEKQLEDDQTVITEELVETDTFLSEEISFQVGDEPKKMGEVTLVISPTGIVSSEQTNEPSETTLVLEELPSETIKPDEIDEVTQQPTKTVVEEVTEIDEQTVPIESTSEDLPEEQYTASESVDIISSYEEIVPSKNDLKDVSAPHEITSVAIPGRVTVDIDTREEDQEEVKTFDVTEVIDETDMIVREQLTMQIGDEPQKLKEVVLMISPAGVVPSEPSREPGHTTEVTTEITVDDSQTTEEVSVSVEEEPAAIVSEKPEEVCVAPVTTPSTDLVEKPSMSTTQPEEEIYFEPENVPRSPDKQTVMEMPIVVSVDDEEEKQLEDDQTVITEELVETDTFLSEEISFQVGDEPKKMGEVTLVISPTGIVSSEQTNEPSETTLVLEELPSETIKPDEIDEVTQQPTKTVVEEVTEIDEQTVTIESTSEDLPEEQYTASESVDIISSYEEIVPSKNDLKDVSAPHEITSVAIPGRVTVDIDTREEDQEEVKTFDVTEVIDETDMIVREELTMQIGDEPQKLEEVVLMISPAGVVPSEPSRELAHTTEVTTEITVDDSQTTEEVSVTVEEEPAVIVSEKPEEVCVAPVTTPSTDLVEKPSMSATQPEEEIYFEPENVPRSPDEQTVMEMPIVVSVEDEEEKQLEDDQTVITEELVETDTFVSEEISFQVGDEPKKMGEVTLVISPTGMVSSEQTDEPSETTLVLDELPSETIKPDEIDEVTLQPTKTVVEEVTEIDELTVPIESTPEDLPEKQYTASESVDIISSYEEIVPSKNDLEDVSAPHEITAVAIPGRVTVDIDTREEDQENVKTFDVTEVIDETDMIVREVLTMQIGDAPQKLEEVVLMISPAGVVPSEPSRELVHTTEVTTEITVDDSQTTEEVYVTVEEEPAVIVSEKPEEVCVAPVTTPSTDLVEKPSMSATQPEEEIYFEPENVPRSPDEQTVMEMPIVVSVEDKEEKQLEDDQTVITEELVETETFVSEEISFQVGDEPKKMGEVTLVISPTGMVSSEQTDEPSETTLVLEELPSETINPDEIDEVTLQPTKTVVEEVNQIDEQTVPIESTPEDSPEEQYTASESVDIISSYEEIVPSKNDLEDVSAPHEITSVAIPGRVTVDIDTREEDQEEVKTFDVTEVIDETDMIVREELIMQIGDEPQKLKEVVLMISPAGVVPSEPSRELVHTTEVTTEITDDDNQTTEEVSVTVEEEPAVIVSEKPEEVCVAPVTTPSTDLVEKPSMSATQPEEEIYFEPENVPQSPDEQTVMEMPIVVSVEDEEEKQLEDDQTVITEELVETDTFVSEEISFQVGDEPKKMGEVTLVISPTGIVSSEQTDKPSETTLVLEELPSETIKPDEIDEVTLQPTKTVVEEVNQIDEQTVPIESTPEDSPEEQYTASESVDIISSYEEIVPSQNDLEDVSAPHEITSVAIPGRVTVDIDTREEDQEEVKTFDVTEVIDETDMIVREELIMQIGDEPQKLKEVVLMISPAGVVPSEPSRELVHTTEVTTEITDDDNQTTEEVSVTVEEEPAVIVSEKPEEVCVAPVTTPSTDLVVKPSMSSTQPEEENYFVPESVPMSSDEQTVMETPIVVSVEDEEEKQLEDDQTVITEELVETDTFVSEEISFQVGDEPKKMGEVTLVISPTGIVSSEQTDEPSETTLVLEELPSETIKPDENDEVTLQPTKTVVEEVTEIDKQTVPIESTPEDSPEEQYTASESVDIISSYEEIVPSKNDLEDVSAPHEITSVAIPGRVTVDIDTREEDQEEVKTFDVTEVIDETDMIVREELTMQIGDEPHKLEEVVLMISPAGVVPSEPSRELVHTTEVTTEITDDDDQTTEEVSVTVEEEPAVIVSEKPEEVCVAAVTTPSTDLVEKPSMSATQPEEEIYFEPENVPQSPDEQTVMEMPIVVSVEDEEEKQLEDDQTVITEELVETDTFVSEEISFQVGDEPKKMGEVTLVISPTGMVSSEQTDEPSETTLVLEELPSETIKPDEIDEVTLQPTKTVVEEVTEIDEQTVPIESTPEDLPEEQYTASESVDIISSYEDIVPSKNDLEDVSAPHEITAVAIPGRVTVDIDTREEDQEEVKTFDVTEVIDETDMLVREVLTMQIGDEPQKLEEVVLMISPAGVVPSEPSRELVHTTEVTTEITVDDSQTTEEVSVTVEEEPAVIVSEKPEEVCVAAVTTPSTDLVEKPSMSATQPEEEIYFEPENVPRSPDEQTVMEMPIVVSVEDEEEKQLEDDQTVITEELVETDTFVSEEISFQVGDEPKKMGEVTLVISPTGMVSSNQADEPSETTLVLEELPSETIKPDEIGEVTLQPTKTVVEEVTEIDEQTVPIESTPEDLPEEQYTASESVDIISSYEEIVPSKNDLKDVSAPHEITSVAIPGRVTVDIDTREEDQEEVKTFDVTEVIDKTDMIVREELTMQIGDEPQKLEEVVLMISPAGVVPSEPSRELVHTTEVTTEITVDDSQTTEEVSVTVEEEPAVIVSEKPEDVCVAPVTTSSTDLVEKPSMSATQPEEEIYFEPENVPRSPDEQTVMEMPIVVSVEDEEEKQLEDDQTVITEELVETDTFVREDISFQVGDESKKMGEVTLVISPTGIVSSEQTDEPSETTLVLEELPSETIKPDEIDDVTLQPTKTVVEEVTQINELTVSFESAPEDVPEEQYGIGESETIKADNDIGEVILQATKTIVENVTLIDEPAVSAESTPEEVPLDIDLDTMQTESQTVCFVEPFSVEEKTSSAQESDVCVEVCETFDTEVEDGSCSSPSVQFPQQIREIPICVKHNVIIEELSDNLPFDSQDDSANQRKPFVEEPEDMTSQLEKSAPNVIQQTMTEAHVIHTLTTLTHTQDNTLNNIDDQAFLDDIPILDEGMSDDREGVSTANVIRRSTDTDKRTEDIQDTPANGDYSKRDVEA